MSTQSHPRIPYERDGIQVNHCKSPVCPNYDVVAAQSSVRGSNSYIPDSRNKGISACICTSCGEGFPLKSNLGITEEVERMASYLLPPNAVSCRNHTKQVPIGTKRAYASFGKTAIGNSRWRCSVCGKTFSQNTKSTARQREHHKNKTIFKLLVNKKLRTFTPKPSINDSISVIDSARFLLLIGSVPLPTSPSADCTLALTDRTTG